MRYYKKKHNYIFGHYFRNLYQILKIIDNHQASEEEKKKYSNILRAQLSSSELAILMINYLNDMVDKGKFRTYIIKYQMLEHIPIELDLNNNIKVSGYSFPILSANNLKQYIPNLKVGFGAFGKNRSLTYPIIKILTKT